ncbi:hypothetical protein AVEN_245454-1, partial [Araneus ventricosus]
MEHTTLILGVVIGAFILTVITVAIAAIIYKRKSSSDHRLSPIEEIRPSPPLLKDLFVSFDSDEELTSQAAEDLVPNLYLNPFGPNGNIRPGDETSFPTYSLIYDLWLDFIPYCKNYVTKACIVRPLHQARSKLPSYREIPFQEALFMKGSGRHKVMLGKYCYNTGQWLGPGPEPKLFHAPESVVYRPPTDSEIRRTPRPPTAV